MKKLFAAALLSAAMVGGVAYAQQSGQAPAQPGAQAPAANPSTMANGQKMDLKGSWRASKLIGLDVYNDGNEKLGDINELIVDKDGKVRVVVIGVGGFLGMGEHDIAVTMDKLKFVEEPMRTSTSSTTAPAERRDTTTGASTTTTTSSGNANDWVPDRAMMSATKDQLKAMPQFKFSDYN